MCRFRFDETKVRREMLPPELVFSVLSPVLVSSFSLLDPHGALASFSPLIPSLLSSLCDCLHSVLLPEQQILQVTLQVNSS